MKKISIVQNYLLFFVIISFFFITFCSKLLRLKIAVRECIKWYELFILTSLLL